MTSLKIALAVLALMILPLHVAHAQDEVKGFVELGAIVTPDFEGSEDYEFQPFGAFRAEYQEYYIESRGPGLRADLSPLDSVDFGPSIRYRGERDDDVENNAVSRLREVDSTLEAGAFVKIKRRQNFHPSDEVSFDVEILSDVGDAHEGTVVSFGPSYSYSPNNKMRLNLSLSGSYASDDYAETYFSVDANNSARSGIRTYNAEGGLKDVGANLFVNYKLGGNWGAAGLIGYTHLVGDFADSPIVDDEGSAGQFIAGAGLTYSF